MWLMSSAEGLSTVCVIFAAVVDISGSWLVQLHGVPSDWWLGSTRDKPPMSVTSNIAQGCLCAWAAELSSIWPDCQDDQDVALSSGTIPMDNIQLKSSCHEWHPPTITQKPSVFGGWCTLNPWDPWDRRQDTFGAWPRSMPPSQHIQSLKNHGNILHQNQLLIPSNTMTKAPKMYKTGVAEWDLRGKSF